MKSIETLLCQNSYPGRGIVLGKSADGNFAIAVYFIMGRSENSRNRIFEKTENGIRTRAFDEAKLSDPSLVIYSPVATQNGHLIVTNGDQTDTICAHLAAGGNFREALLTRSFEPDAPIYTPRISGILSPNGDYTLSILKSADGNPNSARRFFYEYENPLPGEAHFIHTYAGDGNPPQSFSGEPVTVGLSGNFESYARGIWSALHAENRVALFAREIDLKTGASQSLIINALGEEA